MKALSSLADVYDFGDFKFQFAKQKQLVKECSVRRKAENVPGSSLFVRLKRKGCAEISAQPCSY